MKIETKSDCLKLIEKMVAAENDEKVLVYYEDRLITGVELDPEFDWIYKVTIHDDIKPEMRWTERVERADLVEEFWNNRKEINVYLEYSELEG